MAEKPLIDAAREWVIEKYPYNSYHLIKSLEWLDRISPNAREAVRLATLTHDMERAFPGPDQPIPKILDDAEYYKAHSERSARFVCAWMREQAADEALTAEVEKLILVHEFGGWPEANMVQAADSLSFLETNIDLFLGFVRSGRFPASEVRRKFDYSYDRIQVDSARELALPMRDRANARLAELVSEGEVH
jgi:hypothetical protein